jgi:ubiquinone/menaquinone biosynthesis C-methylase UbiE
MNVIPEVTRYKDSSYELLHLRPGMTVLDLGCGVGDDAVRLLEFVQPGGTVIGIDSSAEMIAQARARHLAVQPADPGTESSLEADRPVASLEFLQGPAEGIPLPERSCDAVRVDRVLQHVSDPLVVLREIERVLRPGGAVVLVEPDWRTIAIHPGSFNGGDDDHVLEAVLRWQIAHTRHPLVGRQLRARLRQANFVDVSVLPVAYSSTSFAVMSYVLELATAGEAAVLEDSTRLSEAELRQWFGAAERAEAAGEFFSAVMLYFGLARKNPRTRRN